VQASDGWPVLLFGIANTAFFIDIILDLLAKKSFSEAGSISFRKEQATYVFFRDILHEAEGEKCCVLLLG
jgi:hypothetical protein